MTRLFDVVIVGSGAGGGAVALRCAQAGLQTLVLEKGPQYRRADYTHDELALCRRNFFVPYLADEPRSLREHARVEAAPSNFAWISSCVGGGTVHWSAFAYRFAEADFASWPFGRATLEPYYREAEALLGVSRALRVHPLATHFADRLRQSGLQPAQAPRAILVQGTATRGACSYCGHCGSYGCETGAKGSSQEALLAPARASGRCEIWAERMVNRVGVDRDGRASGVHVRRADGSVEVVRARIVVVAASAIESARLLLLSGVGRQSGLLGKGLMFLTVANGEALFSRGAWPLAAASFFDVSVTLPVGTLNFGLAHTNPIFNAEKLAGFGASAVWGAPLVERLRAHFREGLHLDFEGYSPCTALDTNMVDLDPTLRDRYGLPVARITFDRAAADRAVSGRLAREGLRLFRQAGALRVGAPSAGESLAVLQSGTCRMGLHPRTSVVDASCRLHDCDNVYVADSATFPTSGSVPHTLTIVANALRVGDAIVKRLAR